MSNEVSQREAADLSYMVSVLIRSVSRIDEGGEAMELPVAQLRMCGMLNAGPKNMSALGKRMDISLPAVTQIADRLERIGMVERVPDADDRRVKTLQLTEHGKAVMQAKREKRIARAKEVLARLDPDQRDTVMHAVRILVDACGNDDEDTTGFLNYGD